MKFFLSITVIAIMILGIISFRASSDEVNNENPVSTKSNCTKGKIKKSDVDPFIFQTNPFYL